MGYYAIVFEQKMLFRLIKNLMEFVERELKKEINKQKSFCCASGDKWAGSPIVFLQKMMYDLLECR